MGDRQRHITCWPDVFEEIERQLRPKESRDAWLRRILKMPPRPRKEGSGKRKAVKKKQ